MGWKDTIQTDRAPKTSWRDTVVDDKPPEEPSALNADLRGIASGVTGSFDDEIQGALGAAGRVAGVKNLGSWKPLEPDSHLEYDSPTLDRSELVKSYVANRDAARADKAIDRENFPIRTAAANVAGTVASPLSSLGLVGGGAAIGLGNSNADLTQGDLAGAAKDTAKGAVLAKVLGSLGSKIGAPSTPAGAPAVGVDNFGPRVSSEAPSMLSSLSKAATGGAGHLMSHMAGIPSSVLLAGKAVGQLGKFGPILQHAAARGESALAATHAILSKDPEYIRTLAGLAP